MQRVGAPQNGLSSHQPLVWQAFLTGHMSYYGEKGCCENWYPMTYLYKWVEVHGRFSSVYPAWNPRLSFPNPHIPGSCFTEQPGEYDTFNIGAYPTGDAEQHGFLAVNTAEFSYRYQIREVLFAPADRLGTGGACTIVLMSLGWFTDFEMCPNEPRVKRLRPFFHQFKYVTTYNECPSV